MPVTAARQVPGPAMMTVIGPELPVARPVAAQPQRAAQGSLKIKPFKLPEDGIRAGPGPGGVEKLRVRWQLKIIFYFQMTI